MAKKFITTSIAYINAEPHIGFLLELIAADVLARSSRLAGDEVFFLTGTDEHGLKIQQAIEASGETPQAYADEITEKFRETAKDFNVSNDYFIRTTDSEHVAFIQDIWQRLDKAGVLEKRAYTGFYCTGCEAFKTEREIVDGKCVIHEKPVEKVSEENWFLKIEEHIKAKISDWLPAIYPETKRHEVANVLKEFNEVSVSRPKEKLYWGIEVPGDESQVMYVWVDALFNYLSGIELSGRQINDFWPADIQIVGKDILKFHAIIWPAMLLALDYELPKQLLVHGFVNVEGKKMSKSLGNVISPAQLKERYGVDGTRYLLLRQLNFYDDSNFSWAEFDALYNGELANGIGNLVSRLIGLARKVNLTPAPVSSHSQVIINDFHQELGEINSLINAADKAISEQKLWEATDQKKEALETVRNQVWQVATLLEPFIPDTAAEIRRQLQELDPKPLFPRLEGK